MLVVMKKKKKDNFGMIRFLLIVFKIFLVVVIVFCLNFWYCFDELFGFVEFDDLFFILRYFVCNSS